MAFLQGEVKACEIDEGKALNLDCSDWTLEC